MKVKSTALKLSLILLLGQGIIDSSDANPLVYCSPTFLNGCSGFNTWTNQSISIGSINWTLGASDCLVSDYTGSIASLSAGVSTPMTVVNGVWCGCSVWIDFNHDAYFDSSENLFHNYAGGDPSYTYNFNVTVPSNVSSGTYRMRVIAGWGSDGYSVGSNGYGGCGSYQYGNFDDFLVNIIGAVGIQPVGITNSALSIYPNPAYDQLSIVFTEKVNVVTELTIKNLLGEAVFRKCIGSENQQLDLSFLSPGSYVLELKSKDVFVSQKLIKL